ncbi:tyrosine-protein phosphatase [Sporichthya sp.]|uniref:tyrosine-protein phosphatase n=1 Tax=Sporichthya sp. TaxID=65475 RepID=UPI001810D8FE|nr:tyrosine-protein phosphatase [Sporichthya sp.]MBA3742571.1 tyrosine-protein phosphatase [Sporichthya sp.]
MTDLDERPRFVTVAGLHNLRDVGGYAVAGGGTTRWGQLLRGGALDELNAAAHEPMTGFGLRTIIDMREDKELRGLPDSVFPAGVTNHRSPLYRGRISIAGMDNLPDIYTEILTVCGPEIAAVLELLAAPGGLPAVVHCSAGKDRTGLVIGLLLSVLGVADEVVAQDYAITETAYSDHERERMIRKGLEMGANADRITELMGSPPVVMHTILDWLRAEYGGVEAYLLAGGLRPQSLTALREALVDPAA